jgi:hypothetical protein
VRAPAGHPCAGGFVVPARTGRDACSHGPDPAPPGRDVRRRRSIDELRLETRRHAADVTAASAAAVSGGAVHCVGDGTSGNRVQAIYAYPVGSPDRYDTVAPLIRDWAAGVNYAFRSDLVLKVEGHQTKDFNVEQGTNIYTAQPTKGRYYITSLSLAF